jgi:hypothetical protein
MLDQGGAVVLYNHGLQCTGDFGEVRFACVVPSVVDALRDKIGVVHLPLSDRECHAFKFRQKFVLGFVHVLGDVEGSGVGHHHAHFS